MPKPQSLTSKIKEFYAANRDEFLTVEDAAKKFSVPYRHAYEVLKELSKSEGPLMSMRVYARRPVVQQEQR
jgi:molybdenum-dependent DNA-binding transcriptional regulator ModE